MVKESIEDRFDAACAVIADLTIENHKLTSQLTSSQLAYSEIQGKLRHMNARVCHAGELLSELIEETKVSALASGVLRQRLRAVFSKLQEAVSAT